MQLYKKSTPCNDTNILANTMHSLIYKIVAFIANDIILILLIFGASWYSMSWTVAMILGLLGTLRLCAHWRWSYWNIRLLQLHAVQVASSDVHDGGSMPKSEYRETFNMLKNRMSDEWLYVWLYVWLSVFFHLNNRAIWRGIVIVILHYPM